MKAGRNCPAFFMTKCANFVKIFRRSVSIGLKSIIKKGGVYAVSNPDAECPT